MLAKQLRLTDDEFRALLRDEIQCRRREVGGAWKQLDETLAKRENAH